MRSVIRFWLSALLVFLLTATRGYGKEKPLLKDFMGVNGHYHFKPKLYSQTCRLVRMYHNMNWDVKRPGDPPTFPICVNKVDWNTQVYGKWRQQGGFESSLCIQFGSFGRQNKNYKALWQGQIAWARMYGRELAKYFGPAGAHKLVTSIEIGNEPGGGPDGWDVALYRSVFRALAQGIREGDPLVKILTCTAQARAADKYAVELDVTFNTPDLVALFDAISVHVYAALPHPPKPWPKNRGQWDRSFPEDPRLKYLKIVQEVIDWRDRKAKGKEIWITEFGWDCVTPDAMQRRTGWMKKLNWQGVTDLQQAQYLIRSFLVFAGMDVDRAYMYFYDDKNSPSVHGAAGLTRNFKPKMSFWAMKQLYETLGVYRFHRIIRKDPGRLYIYAFQHGQDPQRQAWVAWRPTGPTPGEEPSGAKQTVTLGPLPARVIRVLGMATTAQAAPAPAWKQIETGRIQLAVGESPVYVLMGPAAEKP